MTRPRPSTKGLVFYESAHRYKLDGQWVPGVTTILNVLSKPALPKWAAKSVAEFVADNRPTVEKLYDAGRAPLVAALKEVPWQKRDDAADRGTSFHDYAERIALGQEVDVPEEFVPLVESALCFMEDYDITPTLIEAVVGSREHRYAGKLDMVANDAIWDWKSGKAIYASAAYQMTAYAFAEFYGEKGDEHPLPPVKAAYGVHIRADGYDVLPLAFGPDIFREFLDIRRVYDTNKRAEGDWRTPGSGYVGRALQPSQRAVG
jgi:hypothetical protein